MIQYTKELLIYNSNAPLNLNSLSAEIKNKIDKIFRVNSATGLTYQVWAPNAGVLQFSALVCGEIYAIESNSLNYNISDNLIIYDHNLCSGLMPTPTSTLTPTETPTSTPTETSTPTPTPIVTATCGDCSSDCITYANVGPPDWNPNNCIKIKPYAVYPLPDGKLPSPLPTYNTETYPIISLPKTIKIDIVEPSGSKCMYSGSYIFESNETRPYPIVNGNVGWGGVSTPQGVCSASLEYFVSDNIFFIAIDGFANMSVLNMTFYPVVRWREIYGDWTIASYKFNKNTPIQNQDINYYYLDGPADSNLCRINIGQGEACPNVAVPDCVEYNFLDSNDDWSITISFDNTCRVPESCPAVGDCLPEIDLYSLNTFVGPSNDECYCSGGGRKIDIDIHCDGKMYPQQIDFPAETTSYTLWFSPKGTLAVPVVENIIYDTTQINGSIVKIHTASSPAEMREWVCKNLRFVTVQDYSKLLTDIDNAVVNNWPFNDLYWGASCNQYLANHPNDIPINLVPC